VVAVEPSAVMIAQRPPGSAPAVQASAEALPLDDGSVDAAMAIFTDHHWSDRAAGMREQLRHDLDDGAWQVGHGDLLGLPELDVGLRLAVRGL
jgi:hypothetical protein